MTGTRLLIVDDSGKPDANHPSAAVVIAGFSMNADRYPTFSRRVLGAKARFHAGRGLPQRWEIKSADVVKPNPWKRSKNRAFLAELLRIIASVGGTCYAATLVKDRMNHPMTLTTTMPLQLKCLVEHFDAECRHLGVTGMVVADWSTHQVDQHASQCVASFVSSRRLDVHPCVYYASSHGNEGVQVADLVAAVRRRVVEGDVDLVAADQAFASLRCSGAGLTRKGRQFSNYVEVL